MANYQPSEINKNRSLTRMAKNIGCTNDRVKQKFLDQMRDKNLSRDDIFKAIIIIRDNKSKEAAEFNINATDTCSAFMEEWTQELYDALR